MTSAYRRSRGVEGDGERRTARRVPRQHQLPRQAPRLLSGVLCTALLVAVLSGCQGGVTPTTSSTTAAPIGDTPTAEAPTAEAPSSDAPSSQDDAVMEGLASLEGEFDATIGVVATSTETGESVEYNSDRRFGYASTVKVFAAAELLRSVHGADRDEVVRWTAEDVADAGYSPVTSQHLVDGLTYAQLAEAAVRQSDNTAFNLVLARIGGPGALDDALAELGDTTTQVVDGEPTLNTIEPGSIENTTTAAAFTASLTTYLDGATLSAADTTLLVDWMSDNRTGDALVRAGAPVGWVVADKSGGAGPVRNDIATVEAPGAAPIVISVLTVRNDPDAPYDDALVARAAALALTALDPTG